MNIYTMNKYQLAIHRFLITWDYGMNAGEDMTDGEFIDMMHAKTELLRELLKEKDGITDNGRN